MREFLNQLSTELVFDGQHIENNVLYIYCSIKRDITKNIHSYYFRKIKDLNLGSYKVMLIIKCPKYYINRRLSSATYTLPLDFADKRQQRTNRLSSYIDELTKESSAIGLERTLKKTVANISDSTILRQIKKKTSNQL